MDEYVVPTIVIAVAVILMGIAGFCARKAADVRRLYDLNWNMSWQQVMAMPVRHVTIDELYELMQEVDFITIEKLKPYDAPLGGAAHGDPELVGIYDNKRIHVATPAQKT